MNFDLSEEQQLIQDTVQRFVNDNYDLEARQKLSATKLGWSEDHWATMAELGWLGLTLPAEAGGFGGDQIDTMLVMETFGKGLVLEPYLAGIVIGANAIARAGNKDQQQALLPGIIDGSIRPTLAHAEEQARFDLDDIALHARTSDGGFILNGQKSMVPYGASATHLIVAARTSGGQQDRQGITLFLIPADTDGVKISNVPTVDGQRAAEITFTDVSVATNGVLGTLDEGFPVLEAVALDAILALSAEAVGIMEMLYKDTVAYTSEREQFDHPLAQFQVLQHRMVDMFMEYEQCKSLLYRATLEVVQHGVEARRTVHALKHFVGKAGIMIGENAVQLHGGMGMTEELRIGHYFKRLLVIDMLFGNADYHLQQFAA